MAATLASRLGDLINGKFTDGFDLPQSDFPHLNTGTSGPSKIIAKAVRQLSLRRLLLPVAIVFVFSIILLFITMLA